MLKDFIKIQAESKADPTDLLTEMLSLISEKSPSFKLNESLSIQERIARDCSKIAEMLPLIKGKKLTIEDFMSIYHEFDVSEKISIVMNQLKSQGWTEPKVLT